MRPHELAAFCRTDRDALLAWHCHRVGAHEVPVPAGILDDLFEDALDMRVIPKVLPAHVLGHCDFDLREICFNTRMRQFALPNTKIEGLVNSTKAHELGHVRLGHERELCAERDDMTMAMFDSPRGGSALVCGRGGSAAHLTREQHADYYASVFLVPEGQLMRLAPAADIEHAWRSGGRLSTAQLWSMVLVLSDHFEVTGALMARRLEDLGWIVRPTCGRCPCNLGFAEGFRNPISRTAEIVKKGPNLSIHPQRWLPLALD